jgi:hypothetical protein
LLDRQHPDGHWCFELECDATITAEYILMMHFVDEIDTALQARMAKYLRAVQRLDGHGAWDLYFGGDLDISCSVKAYFALKAAGDPPDAPHMVRAREAILARRRGEVERVHAHPAGDLRRDPVARHAVHAGGIRAVSALGADPHGQGGLLGAYHDGAAAGAVLDTRRREESAWRARAGTVRHAARTGARILPAQAWTAASVPGRGPRGSPSRTADSACIAPPRHPARGGMVRSPHER